MDNRAHLLGNGSDLGDAADESVVRVKADVLPEYPEEALTAPVSPAFLLGHDEEAPTLVTSRSSLFGQVSIEAPSDHSPTLRGDLRAVQAMLKASVRSEQPDQDSFLGGEDSSTTEESYPLVMPKLPAPEAMPISLVRRKDDWLEDLPQGARQVLEDARGLTPSWPLMTRVVGSVAMPRQKIPSMRS